MGNQYGIDGAHRPHLRDLCLDGVVEWLEAGDSPGNLMVSPDDVLAVVDRLKGRDVRRDLVDVVLRAKQLQKGRWKGSGFLRLLPGPRKAHYLNGEREQVLLLTAADCANLIDLFLGE